MLFTLGLYAAPICGLSCFGVGNKKHPAVKGEDDLPQQRQPKTIPQSAPAKSSIPRAGSIAKPDSSTSAGSNKSVKFSNPPTNYQRKTSPITSGYRTTVRSAKSNYNDMNAMNTLWMMEAMQRQGSGGSDHGQDRVDHDLKVAQSGIANDQYATVPLTDAFQRVESTLSPHQVSDIKSDLSQLQQDQSAGMSASSPEVKAVEADIQHDLGSG